ncbi:(3R)-3-hydroxyacyl-CoA dehydrogenase isoform X6 [Camelus dromedarius]|uniref:(3R)-3-hydroxyacyl-CoA dehydrogenase isoform X6 n=1 Tax=Camelus dromedarius TaxID=9838 RepID=UPI00311A50D6
MASQLRLRSALALVTGAGGGIGRAVSVRLAAEGAAVAACDLDGAAARETACFSRPPSVVVSCAGITRDEFLLHMSEDDWDRVIAVNLKGIFLVNQAAAQALVSSGCPGSIINISSIVGKVGNVGQTNYAASKAGVIGLTQTAAREFGRHGIRCNSVLPGFIKTPMIQKVPQKVLDKEVFSCNCLKDPGLCSHPHHSARPPAAEDSEFPGYKRGGSVWLRNAEYGRQGCL